MTNESDLSTNEEHMTREFISPAQHLAYDKIAPWMKEIFGSAAKEHPDIPVFGVSLGSAFAVVQVAAWQNDARIVVRAYLTTGTELTADLLRELLRRNDTLPFGAFGVDESGDVFIQHSAVGSTCDKLELGSIVMSVLQTADDADDDLIERYGGEMALGYMW